MGDQGWEYLDLGRFWIIHLWVEGFFELFVTVMVAVTFFQLGVVSQITATRIIYPDAIIFLAGGMVGTAHHWYWTGQSNVTMAFAALFSALEVVPLTNLLPGGILQLWDVMQNGYWHARDIAYMSSGYVRLLEWMRLPAGMIFILLGALPAVIAALLTYKYIRFGGELEPSHQTSEDRIQ